VKFPRMEDVDYFTNRPLENENGERTGKIIMFRLKGETKFQYKMICPFCGKEQEGSIEFKRRPYRVPCKHCNKKILIERLKK